MLAICQPDAAVVVPASIAAVTVGLFGSGNRGIFRITIGQISRRYVQVDRQLSSIKDYLILDCS